jgi:hypothetical protein
MRERGDADVQQQGWDAVEQDHTHPRAQTLDHGPRRDNVRAP